MLNEYVTIVTSDQEMILPREVAERSPVLKSKLKSKSEIKLDIDPELFHQIIDLLTKQPLDNSNDDHMEKLSDVAQFLELKPLQKKIHELRNQRFTQND